LLIEHGRILEALRSTRRRHENFTVDDGEVTISTAIVPRAAFREQIKRIRRPAVDLRIKLQ
jgi:hypothetical protein